MDQLANDLSYAMIDVDRKGERIKHEFPARLVPTPIKGCPIKHSSRDEKTAFSSTIIPPIPSFESLRTIKDGKINNLTNNSLSSNDVKKKSTLSSKVKSSKPVLRSASILLRSKKLILSDSESDEGDRHDGPNCPRLLPGASTSSNADRNVPRLFSDYSNWPPKRDRIKKHRRKKEQVKEERSFGQLFLAQSAYPQSFGKRKRSTNPHNHSNSVCSDDVNIPPSGMLPHDEMKDVNQMDFEDSASCESSSLSESNCDSDHFAEADDEQSDFYEFISRSSQKGFSNQMSKPYGEHKTEKYTSSMPIPSNPFASIPPTPSSSFNSLSGPSSAILWKRRRKNT